MARFSRKEVSNMMEEQGMVPLFYYHDINVAKSILSSIYKGGGRLLEFTNRGEFAHEVFAELVKYAAKELPEMILGVGSVTDAGSASLYMQIGANFVVTPVFREDIAIVCNRRKVLWSPGCASLTEICKAEELGCDIVKLFPGGSIGPGFVKGVKGPQPWTKIMPTGGVSPDEDNLKSWFDAGVTCVGMGSKLVSKQIIADKAFDQLEVKVRDTLALIQRLK